MEGFDLRLKLLQLHRCEQFGQAWVAEQSLAISTRTHIDILPVGTVAHVHLRQLALWLGVRYTATPAFGLLAQDEGIRTGSARCVALKQYVMM
jgi:hypothetical protein